MHIEITTNDQVSPAIARFARQQLPTDRQNAVAETMQATLVDVIQLNPVDTARSRSAWVSSLEQLGGIAPPGWQGPHPTGEAAGRTVGRSVQQQSDNQSEILAVNGVTYVPFLEYGTSRMAPTGMVRKSLLRARSLLLERLRQIFRR